MMDLKIDTIDIPSIAAVLINVSDIISSEEINIINDIYSIDGLEALRLTNPDVKKIFYFHIMNGICKYIDASDHNRSHVMYYSSCDLKFLELTNYIENFKIKQFLDTLTKHVMSVMPVKFYSTNMCFDKILNDPLSGEYKEHINVIKNIINKNSKTNTERTRKYLTHNGYTYLNEKYFTKYKQMMFFYK